MADSRLFSLYGKSVGGGSMFVAYHDGLYKVEDFTKEVDGVWLTLEGLAFKVKADWVIII